MRREELEKCLMLTSEFIDKNIGDRSANIFCWLILILTASLTYEVISRYFFHSPTIWSYDVSYMIYGSFFMLGSTYALRTKSHLRTDVFYEKWSVKTQAIVDAVCYVVLFFPGVILIFFASSSEAIESFKLWERTDTSPWRPIIWPFKSVVPISFLLLGIQGVSELAKCVYKIIGGRKEHVVS